MISQRDRQRVLRQLDDKNYDNIQYHYHSNGFTIIMTINEAKYEHKVNFKTERYIYSIHYKDHSENIDYCYVMEKESELYFSDSGVKSIHGWSNLLYTKELKRGYEEWTMRKALGGVLTNE